MRSQTDTESGRESEGKRTSQICAEEGNLLGSHMYTLCTSHGLRASTLPRNLRVFLITSDMGPTKFYCGPWSALAFC